MVAWLKLDQPGWLLHLCGDMLLELDQEILEDWESPRDSLVLIQGVWEEKTAWKTRLLLNHTITNKAKVKTSVVVVLIITAGENERI